MDIHVYEDKFIKGVLDTHTMLKKLDDVKNDEEFWEMVDEIKVGFDEINDARINYYTELKKNGIGPQDCSLTHELYHGIYCLDEKYWDISNLLECLL
jgi:hypothetical protein